MKGSTFTVFRPWCGTYFHYQVNLIFPEDAPYNRVRNFRTCLPLWHEFSSGGGPVSPTFTMIFIHSHFAISLLGKQSLLYSCQDISHNNNGNYEKTELLQMLNVKTKQKVTDYLDNMHSIVNLMFFKRAITFW